MRTRFLTALALSCVFVVTMVTPTTSQPYPDTVISGTVFHDFDADGRLDVSNEPPVVGVILELWAVFDSPYFMDQVNSSQAGEYSFAWPGGADPPVIGEAYAVCMQWPFNFNQTWPRATTRRPSEVQQLFACDDLGPQYLPLGYRFAPRLGDNLTGNDFGIYEGPLPVPQRMADCQDGGWRSVARADGSWFQSLGACISYVRRQA